MKRTLPENWVETTLTEIIDFVIGGDWGKAPEKEWGDEFTLINCIRGSEIRHWKKDKGSTASLRFVKKSSLEKRKLKFGDILLEISGGGPDQPVGRIVFIDNETLAKNENSPKVCTNFLRLVRVMNALDKKFISNYLHYFYLTGEVIKYQGGSNNLRNLKFKEYVTINIPLPPLAEQQRIVAKLDSLFSHLDSLQARLDKIPQLLADFRQSVLTQAVTGKLTEEWRVGKELEDANELVHNLINSRIDNYQKTILISKAQNKKKPRKPRFIGKEYFVEIEYKIPPEWKWEIIDKLFDVAIGATPKRNNAEYWGGAISWVSSGEVANNIISETNETISTLGLENSNVKIYPKGTVLIAMIGEGKTRGQTSILDIEAGSNQNVAALIINNEFISSKYIWYLFLSRYDKTRGGGRGGNQPALNGIKIGNISIPIPPLAEQTEIVRRIEGLFTKADAIQSRYESLRGRIVDLPQAILAKAFRGELVQQLPTDGDARDLLAEIQALRAAALPKKRQKK